MAPKTENIQELMPCFKSTFSLSANAWTVSPEHTEAGRPVLADDTVGFPASGFD